MNGVSQQVHSSAYTVAYQALCSAAAENGSYLDVNEAQECLESTPNLSLAPGTTMAEVLGRMEKWHLIRVSGSRVNFVAR